MHLVANLTRPIRPELPGLMKHSLLCDNKNVGGINMPKVCCPLDTSQREKASETEYSTESPTTTSTESPTTTYEATTEEKM